MVILPEFSMTADPRKVTRDPMLSACRRRQRAFVRAHASRRPVLGDLIENALDAR
jgi:C4-dicarboxylate-specific signal transduction histidine kinase